MKTNKIYQYVYEGAYVFGLGVLVSVALGMMYLAFEPVVSRAITDSFTVTQEITGEVSFATPAADVVMSPPIASITGGTSTGNSQVVVSTNNQPGYTMDINFSNTVAMQGNTQGGQIPNYIPTVATQPDFNFVVPAASAEFAYSVHASNTGDVDSTFQDNGSACGTGGSNSTEGQCWFNPSTTPERIINSTTDIPTSGSTSTILFQLVVNANPIPAIPSDFYVATATLTAVVK